MVVSVPSPYNATFGQHMLNLFICVTFTYHLNVKFPTPIGVGEIYDDQHATRECYVNALKETLQVDTTDPKEHEVD